MAFYLIITTRDHRRVIAGSYQTREAAEAALTEVVSRNLDSIERAELSQDVPQHADASLRPRA